MLPNHNEKPDILHDARSASDAQPRASRSPGGSPWFIRIAACIQMAIVFAGLGYNMRKLHWGFWSDNDSFFPPWTPSDPPPSSKLAEHCKDAQPIQASELVARQTDLARILKSTGSAAYISEPGSNGLYFANVSKAEWKLSERPFLVVITPHTLPTQSSSSSPEISANVTIIAPRFELTRAKSLIVPTSSEDALTFVDWAEDENPYQVLKNYLIKSGIRTGTNALVVDDGARKLIADGLVGAGLHLKPSYPKEVASLRERKTAAELELLKCANEVTLLAIRAVKSRIAIGSRVSQVRRLIYEALETAGLRDVWGLILFGDDAALPHGSGSGIDRTLQQGEFVLMDVGGSLHGYQSDVTRTFAISPSQYLNPRHLEIWYTVKAAQVAALKAVDIGVPAREIDAVARRVIRYRLVELNVMKVGKDVDELFTHRLGHGIGIDGHESPYLVGGESNTAILASNNTFSNEPGIYIPGSVGVRLEDCFYVAKDSDSFVAFGEETKKGHAVLFTEGVGGLAQSPWLP